MLKILAVAAGKLLRYSLRIIRRGGGSALPGLLASKIYPKLLVESLSGLPRGVVVVSGSAGKSSTSHYLVRLLEHHGLKVFANPSTANIRQGLFAAVLKEANLAGSLDFDIAVLELDEGHGAQLSHEFPIRMAVLTNVLSDQLDRFVDPEVVTEKLGQIAGNATLLVVNADDRNLCQLAQLHGAAIGFGLDPNAGMERPVPKYALNFGNHPVIPKQVLVQVGDRLSITCDGKSFDTAQQSYELALNLAAAYCAAAQLLPLNDLSTQKVLGSDSGVFARNELVRFGDRMVNLRLVQNPASFQVNLGELQGDERPLMLMAGKDIHDPSWLWTVDFSELTRVDIVSGYNAAELALRLRVAGVNVGQVIPEVTVASDKFFSLSGEKPTILFSADAMRRFRRHTKVAK